MNVPSVERHLSGWPAGPPQPVMTSMSVSSAAGAGTAAAADRVRAERAAAPSPPPLRVAYSPALCSVKAAESKQRAVIIIVF